MQQIRNSILPNRAITSLAEYFNKELVEILYNYIQSKSIPRTFAADLIAIVRLMIRKIGNHLYNHLPTFGDMVIRSVDIAGDSSKELIVKINNLIKTMLSKYLNVAFHQSKEFLAIGSVEGPIIVYAVKQRQRLKVLEGHEVMISAINFSKKGSRIVSYCEKERALRIWKIKAGILTFTGILKKCYIIFVDRHQKRTKLEYKGKKEDMYPKVEFAQAKNQVILYLSHESAFIFTV